MKLDMTTIKRDISLLKWKTKQRAPEILAVVGGVGAITGFVMGCKASFKVPTIIEEHTAKREQLEDDDKKGKQKLYLETSWKLVRVYGPAVMVFTGSLATIYSSNAMLNRKCKELSLAYSSMAASFNEYRARVIEKYGEEAENDIRFGAHEELTEVPGRKRPVKETKYDGTVDDFARSWYEGCIGHTKSPQENLRFLNSVIKMASHTLETRGYIYLWEIYQMLGFEVTIVSKRAGWVLTPDTKPGELGSYISFGLEDPTYPPNARFIEGVERNAYLKFNCLPDIDAIVVKHHGVPFK